MKKELNYNFFDMNAAAAQKPAFSQTPPANWNFAQEQVVAETAAIPSPHQGPEINDLKMEILEIQKNSKLRTDRYNQSLQRLENQQNQMATDIADKFALLLQKLNEQKKYDQKVQDIVDRHNNLLKGYEVRLNQMQKLLLQKEQDYVEAVTTLKELKAEIARLKRL
ncbi:MAG: hypothetical protein JNL11_13855 [Bdellovibrionaceae bacterium]|nr:hypothetical protein [Pseudobdellovibrionaceae bacterium]